MFAGNGLGILAGMVRDITSHNSPDLAHRTIGQTHYAHELLNPFREAAFSGN